MKQLSQKAIKILHDRILFKSFMWFMPVYCFSVLVIFRPVSYLADIFFFLLVVLGIMFGSWGWSKKIVNDLFRYEVTEDGFKVQINNLVTANETIPYDQIVSVSVYQDYFDRKSGLYSVRMERTEESRIAFATGSGNYIYADSPTECLCGFSREEAEALCNEILHAKRNQKQEVKIESQASVYQYQHSSKIKYFLYGFSILSLVLAVGVNFFLNKEGADFFTPLYLFLALLFAVTGLYSEKIINKLLNSK